MPLNNNSWLAVLFPFMTTHALGVLSVVMNPPIAHNYFYRSGIIFTAWWNEIIWKYKEKTGHLWHVSLDK